MGLFLKDINLKGKTALITGATKGLGRGAAIAVSYTHLTLPTKLEV